MVCLLTAIITHLSYAYIIVTSDMVKASSVAIIILHSGTPYGVLTRGRTGVQG